MDARYHLPSGGGDAYWFLNTLFTVKAGRHETGEAFTFAEQLCPAGFAPPPHVHHREVEAFYLLEGSMSVTCGDDTWQAEPGSFVLLPPGVPHSFTVSDNGPARLVHLTAPAQFEQFVREVGEPATELSLPEPGVPDMQRMLDVLPDYGLEILLPGGPPASPSGEWKLTDAHIRTQ